MTIAIEKLPYAESDLEPYISRQTLFYHYQKHYLNYVKTANELLVDTPFRDKSLKEIILISASDTLYTRLFQNVAQVFNHNFYWNSLKPKTLIPDDLNKLLIKNFGSADDFKSQLLSQAMSQFASGYVWLIADQNKNLKIITTSNALNPLTQPDLTPLCCIDVWEHAYYLDYQNNRAEYLQNIINNLLNWDFIRDNYKRLV